MKSVKTPPDKYPIVVCLEAALMANGEVIHFGKSLGFVSKRQMELVESGASKMARGTEHIVAIKVNGKSENWCA